MPLYVYCCPGCGYKEEQFLSVELRHGASCSKCGERTKKEFTAPHLDILEPYFDEGLGCDVHSAAHRRRVMREQGVIEAGDRVGGSINFDKHAPEHVGKLPQKGREWTQHVLHKEQPVVSVGKDGTPNDVKGWSELEVV